MTKRLGDDRVRMLAYNGSIPGLWMAHCHIAEHHESGMMFSFRVDLQPEPGA